MNATSVRKEWAKNKLRLLDRVNVRFGEDNTDIDGIDKDSLWWYIDILFTEVDELAKYANELESMLK